MSLFLSRLQLNSFSRHVQRDLADCQGLHRRVMSAFPSHNEGEARKEFGVLFRPEILGESVTLLVQSAFEPNWGGLPDNYLTPDWFDGTSVAVKQLDGVIEALNLGRTLRFRLRANPTRRIDTKSGPDGARRHGRRVPLRQEEARLAWLRRRAGLAGFSVLETVAPVPQVVTSAFERVRGRRPSTIAPDRAQAITLEGVVFDGLLQVEDVDRLRRAMVEGIGPGKAYGFGLLSLAPVE